MVNERCVCLFVSKLDESSFLYKYWVGNISSSLFPFNPVKQGLSIPPDYISLYTKKEGERNKKTCFFRMIPNEIRLQHADRIPHYLIRWVQ
jgi:hypothetical protein